MTLDRSISTSRGIFLVFIIMLFRDISVFHADIVDPDQMPHSVASDMGLHCLPMSCIDRYTFTRPLFIYS